MPHYLIKSKQTDEATTPVLRIVEAKNAARALSHVVEDTLIICQAEPADFMALARTGREIEKAE